jgi:hypothetical protein
LRNQEYEFLEALSDEIKDFE